MNHHLHEWVDAYIDGELPLAQRAQIEDHLKICPLCQELLEQRRSLTNLMQAAPPLSIRKTEQQFVAEVGLLLERRTYPPERATRRWAWPVIPLALVVVWAFIQTVAVASLVVGLLPEVGQSLLGTLGQPQASQALSQAGASLLGVLGLFDFLIWNRLTAAIALLVVSVLYAGWLAAWWAHHRHAAEGIVFERTLQ